MSRIMPYRLHCPEKCLHAQNQALNSTFFILRQTGPTAFVIKDNQRLFKVSLGDQHQCTCHAFQRNQDLCKHICWLLLKRFRIPRTNSMVWQQGLVEREINELLRQLTRENLNRKIHSQIENENSIEVEQRSIEDNDVCPICQEEFLSKKLPITYCRHGCGNSVHIKCMKIWLDHQVSIGETMIKCPLCREIFGTPEKLKEEFRENGIQPIERSSIHLGYSCHRCHICPITNKCYKCTTCENYYLCQECFNLNIHNEHSFDYRERPFQQWKIAIREHLTALPQAIHQRLVNRDINENDYEILFQLENAQNMTIRGVPENVVNALPSERINEYSELLKNNEQCRLCLKIYQLGQCVRRLPCRHQFHMDCIDGWLLHSHSTCPIDGQFVWNGGEIENNRREMKRSSIGNTRKISSQQFNSSSISSQMGLTILPYRIQTALPSYSNPHRRVSFRPLISSISSSLDINIRNRPQSANNNQRRFHSETFPIENLLPYRLSHRSYSTKK